MNKNDLIKAVAKDTDSTDANIAKTLASLTSIITTALKKGDDVKLLGFGTFCTKRTKARTGRNPQTGASIKISAKTIAKFTPGVQLAQAVSK